MTWSTEAIDALARQFEAGTVAKAEWTHTAHQIVALHHVRRFGATERRATNARPDCTDFSRQTASIQGAITKR